MRIKSLIVLILFLACCRCSADGEEPSSIVSACESEYPPFMFFKEGKSQGLAIDLMRDVCRKTGMEVKFVNGQWSELKKQLKNGSIDTIPYMVRTPAREKFYDFTFPYLTMHGAIVVRKGEGKIVSVSDLKGKRVAVLKGSVLGEFLITQNVGANIHEVKNVYSGMLLVQKGVMDAIVIQRLVFNHLALLHGVDDLEPVAGMQESLRLPFCIAVKKGNPALLSKLNEGLALVLADGEFHQLQKKWFSDFEQHPKGLSRLQIVVGGDWNYPPYEYLDKKGRPTGFNVELTKAIARKMGMDVSIELSQWSTVRSGLVSNKIAAVEGMFYSPERAREFIFSPPHSIVNHVAVVKEGNPVPESVKDLQGLSLVVMRGDIMHDWARENGLENRLQLAGTQEEALQAVRNGGADCALVAQIPAIYWVTHEKIEGLEIGSVSLLSPEYCYAVASENFALISKFTEGLAALKQTGEYRKIRDKWLAPYDPVGSWTRITQISTFIILPFLGIVFVLLLWGYVLRGRVRVARQHILESEARWRFALESSGDGLWEFNHQTGAAHFSERYKKMLEYEENSFPDTVDLWVELIHPEDKAGVCDLMQKYLAAQTEGLDCTCRMRCRSGRYKWVMARGMVLERNAQRVPVKIIGTSTDITEFIQTREALEDSRQRLQIAASVVGMGVWEHDFESNIITVDDQIRHIYGINDESGAVTIDRWAEYLHPEERQQVLQQYRKAVEFGRDYEAEYRIVRSGGQVRYLHAMSRFQRDHAGKPVRMIGINRDITESKLMNQQMRQMEKMNSLGQLAGGIAHDFNNQLAGIMGFSELLLNGARTEEETGYLEGILGGVKHLSGLTKQMLAFARKGQYRIEQIGVHVIFKDVLKILEHSFDKKIFFNVQMNAPFDTVRGDHTQLQNAFLHLAINSRDAMPDGGTLVVKTSNVEAHVDANGVVSETVNGNTHLKIEISDNGCGFDEKTAEHIFEPFFTTKEPGKGVGMGLPAVLGTIQNHYGHLNIVSKPGKGTTVTVYLPVSRGTLLLDLIEDSVGVFMGKRILVIDPNVAGAFGTHSYTYWSQNVNEPSFFDRAVEFFRKQSAEIDYVLVDLDIPGIMPVTALEKLKDVKPEVSVVFCGFQKPDDFSELLAKGADGFMQKPLLQAELKEIIGMSNDYTGDEITRDGAVAETSQEEQAEAPVSLNGKILVIDDEQVVRKALEISLVIDGFDVVCVDSGQKGLQLYREAPEKYSLIFLDLIMPDMRGDEVFQALREINPESRIVIISGYTSDILDEGILGKRNVWFVQKPFERAALNELIRKVMDD